VADRSRRLNTNVLVRPARADEMKALGALQLRASLAYGDLREELLGLPEAGIVPDDQLPHAIVAEIDGRIAGFAVVLPREDGGAELDGLFVEPKLWRTGLGKCLVEASFELARDRGAPFMNVIANRRALGFYDACGFEIVGETMTLFEPAPVMRIALAQL